MLRIAHEGLTFDDVLLLPGYSEVTAKDVSLVTRLTRNIPLNIPLVSAAMDTVTESRLAIALAQEGGIGIIHKNMTIQEQAEEVRRVKKFESGVVKDPITIESTASIADLIDLTRANGISGVPVMEAGNLVGIVTRRDIRFETDTAQPVSAIMTKKKKLVTVKEGAPLEEVQRLLHEHRIEKILVVDDDFGLKGLITVKDFDKAESFPHACKDEFGQLRVGASVGTSPDTDERVEALIRAGVDVLVVDTAHGHSRNVLGAGRHDQGSLSGGGCHWRQHSDSGGGTGTARRRRRCSEGWDRTGLNLHDPNRDRRRCATNFCNCCGIGGLG